MAAFTVEDLELIVATPPEAFRDMTQQPRLQQATHAFSETLRDKLDLSQSAYFKDLDVDSQANIMGWLRGRRTSLQAPDGVIPWLKEQAREELATRHTDQTKVEPAPISSMVGYRSFSRKKGVNGYLLHDTTTNKATLPRGTIVTTDYTKSVFARNTKHLERLKREGSLRCISRTTAILLRDTQFSTPSAAVSFCFGTSKAITHMKGTKNQGEIESKVSALRDRVDPPTPLPPAPQPPGTEVHVLSVYEVGNIGKTAKKVQQQTRQHYSTTVLLDTMRFRLDDLPNKSPEGIAELATKVASFLSKVDFANWKGQTGSPSHAASSQVWMAEGIQKTTASSSSSSMQATLFHFRNYSTLSLQSTFFEVVMSAGFRVVYTDKAVVVVASHPGLCSANIVKELHKWTKLQINTCLDNPPQAVLETAIPSCRIAKLYSSTPKPLVYPTQAKVANELFGRIRDRLKTSGKWDSFTKFRFVIVSPNRCSLQKQTQERLESYMAWLATETELLDGSVRDEHTANPIQCMEGGIGFTCLQAGVGKKNINGFANFWKEVTSKPKTLFLLVQDECHWGIPSGGTVDLVINTPSLLHAASKVGNLVSLQVSATPYNNMATVLADNVVEFSQPASYTGMKELLDQNLCHAPHLRYEALLKRVNSNFSGRMDRCMSCTDAALTIDYACALIAVATGEDRDVAQRFECSPATVSAMRTLVDVRDGKLTAPEKPSLVVVRMSHQGAARFFVKQLTDVRDRLGLENAFAVMADLSGSGCPQFAERIAEAEQQKWLPNVTRSSRYSGFDGSEAEHGRTLHGVPALLVLLDKGRMGDTFPPHFRHFDLRRRYEKQVFYSTFVQDVGRAMGYGERPEVRLSTRGFQVASDPNKADKVDQYVVSRSTAAEADATEADATEADATIMEAEQREECGSRQFFEPTPKSMYDILKKMHEMHGLSDKIATKLSAKRFVEVARHFKFNVSADEGEDFFGSSAQFDKDAALQLRFLLSASPQCGKTGTFLHLIRLFGESFPEPKEEEEHVQKGSAFSDLNERIYSKSHKQIVKWFSKKKNWERYHRLYDEARKIGRYHPVTPVNEVVEEVVADRESMCLVADLGAGKQRYIEHQLAGNQLVKVHNFDLGYEEDFLRNHPNCFKQDITNLTGIADDSYNLCILSLSMVGADPTPFIKEARRILKNKGRLLITETRSHIENNSAFLTALKKRGFSKAKSVPSGSPAFVSFQAWKDSNPRERPSGKMPLLRLRVLESDDKDD